LCHTPTDLQTQEKKQEKNFGLSGHHLGCGKQIYQLCS